MGRLNFTSSLTSNITEYELLEDYFIYNWLKDKNNDLELTRRLKSIATTRPPIIAQEKKTLLDKFQQSDVYFDNKQALGFSAAFLDKSLALSFLSQDIWAEDSIAATHAYYNTQYQFKEEDIKIQHVSLIGHLLAHASWVQNVLPVPEYDIALPLPFPIISKYMLPDDFYLTALRLDKDERIAAYTNWAEKIAVVNWYQYNPTLSKINNRNIYHIGEGRNRIYLALDTQHGRFECCDNQGKHKGEFDFLGNKTKEEDKQRKHDIVVK